MARGGGRAGENRACHPRSVCAGAEPEQSAEDRENYIKLLDTYEQNLELFEEMIILRSRVLVGTEGWNSELQQQFVQTRDGIYDNLERNDPSYKDMGIFQKLDILEGRLVGIAEQRKRRDELQTRQAEIENHPMFIKRTPPVT